MKNEKRLLLITHYGFFILLAGLLTAVIIIQERNFRNQQERVAALEEAVREEFIRQTELLLEFTAQEIAQSTDETVRQITEGTASTKDRIQETNSRIHQIDAVYSGLLAEQQKRTLDSLYTEGGLAEMERQAAALFREGKYSTASAQYAVIAQARPENSEARFFHLYSLFLSNRLDRGNYRQIREGLQTLERNGYHRPEIRDVLDFIEAEDGGPPQRAGASR